jgi:hypothetical protein
MMPLLPVNGLVCFLVIIQRHIPDRNGSKNMHCNLGKKA